jgi:hypothetical protein
LGLTRKTSSRFSNASTEEKARVRDSEGGVRLLRLRPEFFFDRSDFFLAESTV